MLAPSQKNKLVVKNTENHHLLDPSGSADPDPHLVFPTAVRPTVENAKESVSFNRTSERSRSEISAAET